MKKITLSFITLISLTAVASAGSIRVYNSDSKSHKIELKCSGSSKTVEIDPSKTTTYTFHSTSKECDIVGGSIKFPTTKLTDGGSWKIKDGVATKE
ncbi:MAG TPA: hypothetical protein PLF40_02750 [Kofleriaceae bacterium]|nr:hypothetical protein [Kofleriaceae bacterium]